MEEASFHIPVLLPAEATRLVKILFRREIDKGFGFGMAHATSDPLASICASVQATTSTSRRENRPWRRCRGGKQIGKNREAGAMGNPHSL
jgi:hypothetical protein